LSVTSIMQGSVMNDYSHLRLHDARTRQNSRSFHAGTLHTGRRQPWRRRLLQTLTGHSSGMRRGGEGPQRPAAAPDRRAASA
jgi:hypothetical protein